VVLTGHLDCGTAGLMSIKARGGLTVVQAPDEAFAKEMPKSALEHVQVDHVSPVGELPALLGRLVTEPPGPQGRVGAAIAQLEGDEPGAPVEVV
jgi:two-component system, chemotaxis family, protein-glutamate methylesterase/glutaminase